MAAIIIVVAVGAAIFVQFSKPLAPGESPHTGRTMSLRAEKTPDGDWIIYLVSSSWSIKELNLKITNASTGSQMFGVRLSEITVDNNHAEALLNDSNANDRFDAGDSIILKGTSPRIQTGYKLQFFTKESTVGTIQELP